MHGVRQSVQADCLQAILYPPSVRWANLWKGPLRQANTTHQDSNVWHECWEGSGIQLCSLRVSGTVSDTAGLSTSHHSGWIQYCQSKAYSRELMTNTQATYMSLAGANRLQCFGYWCLTLLLTHNVSVLQQCSICLCGLIPAVFICCVHSQQSVHLPYSWLPLCRPMRAACSTTCCPLLTGVGCANDSSKQTTSLLVCYAVPALPPAPHHSPMSPAAVMPPHQCLC